MKRPILYCCVIYIGVLGCDFPSVTKPKQLTLNAIEVHQMYEMDSIAIYNEAGSIKYYHYYTPDPSDTTYVFKYANHIKGYSKSDTIYGYFNSDRVKDTAWIINDLEKCNKALGAKDCDAVIKFSDRTIPSITIDFCPIGYPHNEGDLNGDGIDEIGLLPGWTSSTCRFYQVHGFKGKKWKQLFSLSNTLNMREAGIKPIEKDRSREGWVVVRHSFENSIGCNCQMCEVVETVLKLEND